MPDHPIWSANKRLKDNNLTLMASLIEIRFIKAYYHDFWERKENEITT